MLHIDLLLFDVDGTLIDSRKDIVMAVNHTLSASGLPEKSFDTIVSYIGYGVRDLLRKSLETDTEQRVNEALVIFEDYYKKHCADESKIYPGVSEVLDYFGKRKKVLVTNRNKKYAEITLERLGLRGYFVEIMGGDDEKCSKPEACQLNAMLEQFDVPKEKAIMIGDMAIDIAAGKNAGVHTCGVTYGIGKEEDIVREKPDYLINNISELKTIIKSG